MSKISGKLREGGLVLGALGVIGFIGIVWLMIYGSLSGNLGFGSDTETTALQELELNNITVVTLTGTIGKVNPVASSVVVINASGVGEVLTATNYTLTDTTITGSAIITDFNATDVNVSYIVTYDSSGKANTEGVINNVTAGFGTFFGFANTWFTIAAIVLLIFMLVGLLAIVMKIAQGRKGKKSGYK